MAAWCAERDVALAPHVKTTMSEPVVARQVAAGAVGVTVATVDQAGIALGWGHDVLIANEVVDAPGLAGLRRLVEQHPEREVRCLVDSEAGVAAARAAFAGAGAALEVMVDVGTPGGRTGVRTRDEARRDRPAGGAGVGAAAGRGRGLRGRRAQRPDVHRPRRGGRPLRRRPGRLPRPRRRLRDRPAGLHHGRLRLPRPRRRAPAVHGRRARHAAAAPVGLLRHARPRDLRPGDAVPRSSGPRSPCAPPSSRRRSPAPWSSGPASGTCRTTSSPRSSWPSTTPRAGRGCRRGGCARCTTSTRC